MATREEIRGMLCDELRPELASAQRTDYVVNGLMNRLNDKGVVIKVKCPDCEWGQFGEEVVGMTPCNSCNSMGYIIEPLIKGE